MLRATREANGRTTSNIRWNYGHTTIPRHLRDIVVTEYGIADLRGKTDRDVIAAMLAVADSRFQDELLRQRQGRRQDRAGASSCRPACRDNTPERIARALAPAREQGLLPPFPFGTDFTDDRAAADPGAAAAAAPPRRCDWPACWRAGCSSARRRRRCADCLARMGLDQPIDAARSIVYAALLRGALG